MRKLLSLCMFGLIAGIVMAQEQPPEQPPEEPKADHIVTDRPSFTTDTNMVDPGRFQLELGYTYTDLNDGGDQSTFPEALGRYGLNERWELRLGWDGYSWYSDDDDFASGTDLGVKWKFKDAGDPVSMLNLLTDFDMALIGTLTLPTGSGPNDVDYELLLGWNYQLDDVSGLAGNLGFGGPTDTETGDRFVQGIASIMYSRDISQYLNNTSCFGEFYTTFPSADDNGEEYVIQGGVLHRITDNMQVDMRAGFGLNDNSPDWLIGVGFAYRF